MAAYTDEQMDLVMGRVLQVGVTIAALLMLAGGALYIVRHGSEPVAYSTFRGVPDNLKNPAGIFQLIAEGHGKGLIQLGALVMIATPVMRVIFAAFAFARERDGLYVMISLIVLGALCWGLFGGQ